MSYQQAMKWQRKHPKGTRQPMLFHTGTGSWPAAICGECGNHYNSENHKQHCKNPEYQNLPRRVA
jgi:hypothetical protein